MEAKQKGNRRDKKAAGAYTALQAAQNTVMARLYKRKAFGELTPSQFRVLATLLEQGSQSQTALCGAIARSTGNMVLVIDNLTKAGLVKREGSKEDRRVKLVVLTDQGRKIVSDLIDGHNQAVGEAMTPLNEQQLAELAALAAALAGPEDCTES